MRDNKKKIIVIAALGFVIVTVGVFQFVQGVSGPLPKFASGQKSIKRAATDKPKVDTVKNEMFANLLKPRDPFEVGELPVDPTKTPTPAATAPAPAAPKQHESRGSVMPPVTFKEGSFSGAIGDPGLKVQADPAPKFAFRLSGVMLGAKPMAVFTDAQGDQRLILLGGSLDPESSVLSIDKDAVTVRFHGKTLRLTVEGNPNAK